MALSPREARLPLRSLRQMHNQSPSNNIVANDTHGHQWTRQTLNSGGGHDSSPAGAKLWKVTSPELLSASCNTLTRFGRASAAACNIAAAGATSIGRCSADNPP